MNRVEVIHKFVDHIVVGSSGLDQCCKRSCDDGCILVPSRDERKQVVVVVDCRGSFAEPGFSLRPSVLVPAQEFRLAVFDDAIQAILGPVEVLGCRCARSLLVLLYLLDEPFPCIIEIFGEFIKTLILLFEFFCSNTIAFQYRLLFHASALLHLWLVGQMAHCLAYGS